MSYRRKPPSQSKRPTYSQQTPRGLPAWLIFLLGIASVFGMYYLWLGFTNYVNSGGLGILEATEQVVIIATTTAEQIQTQQVAITAPPSATPMPECQDFRVRVPSAVVRQGPSTASTPLDQLSQGETVCVITRETESEWYLIDNNPTTRRIEAAYMHEDIIEALNPTMTPTNTLTPAPSVTLEPATRTPIPPPTITPDANATETPTPTASPTATAAVRSL